MNEESFIFADTPPRPSGPSRLALISEATDVLALLESLATELAFPAWCGNNWDALLDCLRDLTWISEHTVVIYHQKLPVLGREELKTYISILDIAVGEWIDRNEHELVVGFPRAAGPLIRDLLDDWRNTERWSPE